MKYNMWDMTVAFLGFVVGLITSMALVASYVKWVVWAGSGWLW